MLRILQKNDTQNTQERLNSEYSRTMIHGFFLELETGKMFVHTQDFCGNFVLQDGKREHFIEYNLKQIADFLFFKPLFLSQGRVKRATKTYNLGFCWESFAESKMVDFSLFATKSVHVARFTGPRPPCFAESNETPGHGVTPAQNFIQSEVRIHTTSKNLICYQTGLTRGQ